ncbi:Hypothetical predicted protein [Olea europaea subsp. europaea]|uniref:Uncharacterized protein n=1 Tax=Olea europaea subsp. europaea TaxID=158383 RepID=A0A8S0RR19_OLEEU|nr:Hypothetical predicted protein [Olea europaea subsp. europaea]
MYKSSRVLSYPRGRSCPTTAAAATGAEMKASVLGSLPEDAAHITPCQDDVNLPVVAASEEVQDAGATEPSNAVEDDDEEAEGCDAMDGDDKLIGYIGSGAVTYWIK